MPDPFSPNQPFDQVFLLKGIDERRTKSGKPYLAVVLGTPEGAWEARVWDMAMSSLPGLLEGDPVRAKGTVQLYQDKIQLIVDNISKADGNVDPRNIYPAADASEAQLRSDFDRFVADLKDPAYIKLMDAMREDKPLSDPFFVCPAAITMHHARIGGLAEHSINVCRLALGATETAPWLDRDLLTVGALLHDIGKIQEYEAAGDFRYTLEGKFIGHIVQGHSIVERWIRQIPEFPERVALDLLHIILSHHGQLEYGSPKTPATAEALVIHFADDLDAKLDMIKTAGEEPGTEEAFVRGLRRSFQYRNEQPDTETPRHGDAEEDLIAEEPFEGVRGKSSFANASRPATADREEEGEEKLETGKQRNGETEKKRTESRTHPSKGSGQADQLDAETRGRGDAEEKAEKGKKEGQEELF